jgi:hypothetical protein
MQGVRFGACLYVRLSQTIINGVVPHTTTAEFA